MGGLDLQQHYLGLLEEVRALALQCGRSPSDITVVAVSKTHPIEAVEVIHAAGCRDFGESRVQEALQKMESASPSIQWHLVGSLQTKKVKKVIGRFALIHSVDTPELAQHIAQASVEQNAVTRILLQVNTSGETSKHGLSPQSWEEQIAATLKLPGLQVDGLMTMAPLTEDKAKVADCFALLRLFRDRLQAEHGVKLPHLSMGMSHDYPIAIAEGATLLRIGTLLFS